MTQPFKMVNGEETPLSDDDLAQLEIDIGNAVSDRWSQVRIERNVKLTESDWTQLPDAPVDAAAWAEYRQALRDVTDQTDPFDITWPTAPGA